MNTVAICSNTKAHVIKALALVTGVSKGLTVNELYHTLYLNGEASCHKTVYNAVAGLLELELIVGNGRTPEAFVLTRKGGLVADALDLHEVILQLHERGGESEHHAKMIARAEHRARRLVERLAKAD